MSTIRELVEEYRQSSIGMDSISNPQEANRCHDRWHACYKLLRKTQEGREAIIELLQDPEPSVRCAAAAHSLQWTPAIARCILEALRDSQARCSFEAEMILKEYDKGRLTFSY
jgi:hypothetical protein